VNGIKNTMIKLFIIDDEPLVRRGIRETISWKDYDIEIIGEASNGQDGYQKIKELNPDIVISDIRMPGCTGIELLERLRNDNFLGEFIILSGYKDFEYAKSAIENSVISYILKPFENIELVNSVLKAIKKIQKRNSEKDKNKLLGKDQVVLNLLLEGSFENETINETLNEYQITIPLKGQLLIIEKDEGADRNVLLTVKDIIENEFKKDLIFYESFLLEEKLVFFTVPIEIDNYKSILFRVISDFENKLFETLSLIVSNVYTSFKELRTSYYNALNICKSRLFLGINILNFQDDLNKKYNKNVLLVLDYIKRNYPNKLSMYDVGEQLEMSSSSIMHTLKANLNITFNDVLTRHRIYVAKNLLLKNYRINEVADKVGLPATYFSKLFKKYLGLNPTDFIKNKI
jgi:two-component system response regulator YesN